MIIRQNRHMQHDARIFKFQFPLLLPNLLDLPQALISSDDLNNNLLTQCALNKLHNNQ